MNECIFCKIISKEIPADIVFEDEHCLAFKDIHPTAPVHALIIPKHHIPTLNDLTSLDVNIIGHIVNTAITLSKKLGIAEDGYRLVANCNKDAGQVVYHVHFHLLGGRPFSWPPG